MSCLSTERRDQIEKNLLEAWKQNKGYTYPLTKKQADEFLREFHRITAMPDISLIKEYHNEGSYNEASINNN